MLTAIWDCATNCSTCAKHRVFRPSQLHLRRYSLNLARNVLMMTWQCICTSWLWSRWHNNGLWCNDPQYLAMQNSWLNVQMKRWCGSAEGTTRLTGQTPKTTTTSNVATSQTIAMFPNTQIVVTRGAHPWSLAQWTRKKRIITVGSRDISSVIVGNWMVCPPTWKTTSPVWKTNRFHLLRLQKTDFG